MKKLESYPSDLDAAQKKNVALNEKIEELQAQLNHAKKELDDYITQFDKKNVVNFKGNNKNAINNTK
jgi:uncharacterized protein involved in exopolysaccharide biosynthesis